MRNMIFRKMLRGVVIAICSALVGGCATERPVSLAVDRRPVLEMHISDIPETSSERSAAQEKRYHEIERQAYIHNAEMYEKAEQTIATCYAACTKENESRMSKWHELEAMRETVRNTCTTMGTRNKGRPDLIVTDESSPTAHNRIVENEFTGRLEYREGRHDVVEILPKWVCPKESSGAMKEVADKWMDRYPMKLAPRPCDMLKMSENYRQLRYEEVDVCLRWVEMPGFQ